MASGGGLVTRLAACATSGRPIANRPRIHNPPHIKCENALVVQVFLWGGLSGREVAFSHFRRLGRLPGWLFLFANHNAPALDRHFPVDDESDRL